MAQRALLSALLLAALGSFAACDPAAGDLDPSGGKADDFGSCAESTDCGTRDIEVIFTNPFCDECQNDEKAVLLERSQIIERVVSLIEGATTEIDIAQFTFSRKEIEEALLAAHARGVNIRMAMDSGQDNSGSAATRLRDAGLAVRFVKGKPVDASRSGLLHTKFMLVDKTTLLSGSNNWSSTGTSINNENTMVIKGRSDDELLAGFACHFRTIWDSRFDDAAACSGQNVFFTPGGAAKTMIRDSIRHAHTSIDVLMHHFTLAELATELAKAQERGVAVRLVVNEADRGEVGGSAFVRLQEAGGQIHFKRVNEAAFQFMHDKLAIIDGQMLINGSGNWSGTGFFNNYENYVRYFEPAVVRQYEDMYDRLWSWSLSAEGLDAGLSAAEQHAQETQAFFGSLHGHFHVSESGHNLDDGKDHRLDADGLQVAVDVGATVAEAATHAFRYAQENAGLDFMALSPHTTDDNANDPADTANMSEEAFAEMLQASERFNQDAGNSLIAISSMEWSTNSTGNHVGILGTSKIAKSKRGQFDELYDGFLSERLASGERPLLMFNHPRTLRENPEFLTGSWDQVFGVSLLEVENNSERTKKFNDYGLDDYSPLREILPTWIDGSAMPDESVVAETLQNIRAASAPYARLMEVTMGRGSEIGTEDSQNPSLSEDENGEISRRTKVHTDYDYYLSRGFRLAPVANHDNHFANWGTGHSSRTGVVSQGLSTKKLLDALDRRRVFASEDENLSVQYYVNGRVPMGSETATTAGQVSISALITDPDYDGSYEVRVFRGTTSGEAVAQVASQVLASDGWLALDVDLKGSATNIIYLEILEVDANRMAWTAPVWVEAIN